MKDFTIIIPTYNRIELVKKAIDSSLIFVKNANGKADIIIVDDHSDDCTAQFISEKYAINLNSGEIKLIANKINLGVVASRNIAAKYSESKWLIFLDSDNELTFDSFEVISKFANLNPESPCIVFRACDQNNNLIGDSICPAVLSISVFLNDNLGELFGVYKRNVFIDTFSDKLLEKLRRFEVIGVCRTVKKYGNFALSNKVVRVYHLDNDDRLCDVKNLIKDARLLMIGNYYLFKEFFFEMSYKTKIRTILKIIRYYYLMKFKTETEDLQGR